MLGADHVESHEPNHPLAFRMGVIAFLNQNITIACLWGSFSVLLGAVEQRLGVGREMSTLAVPVVSLATALCAPVSGVLAAKYSLRLILLIGTILSTAGFALLAVTTSFPLYLLAFGLLLGPGMGIGAVLPPTLVTRWFVAHRGRALGIVCAPVIVAVVPLGATWSLQGLGLGTTYALLAGLSAVSLVANLFIVDRPPGAAPITGAAAGAPAPALPHDGMGMGRLLGTPRFWALALAFIASIAGSMIITAHMVPMAQQWGFSPAAAATLLTVQSLVGIGGTVLFGWVADRLGGALALAILLFDAALLWLLLLLGLPFVPTLVIVGLIGLHGAGAIPALGVALADHFGRESFSRAYGLINLINLPFSVVTVPGAAMIYAHTGSYAGAIMAQAAFLGLACVMALAASRKRPAVAAR